MANSRLGNAFCECVYLFMTVKNVSVQPLIFMIGHID